MINKFVERLKKIGVNVELMGNYPWIYLHKVNGIRVQGTFMANHGFSAFTLGVNDGVHRISDRRVLFNKIRETLNGSDIQ